MHQMIPLISRPLLSWLNTMLNGCQKNWPKNLKSLLLWWKALTLFLSWLVLAHLILPQKEITANFFKEALWLRDFNLEKTLPLKIIWFWKIHVYSKLRRRVIGSEIPFDKQYQSPLAHQILQIRWLICGIAPINWIEHNLRRIFSKCSFVHYSDHKIWFWNIFKMIVFKFCFFQTGFLVFEIVGVLNVEWKLPFGKTNRSNYNTCTITISSASNLIACGLTGNRYTILQVNAPQLQTTTHAPSQYLQPQLWSLVV